MWIDSLFGISLKWLIEKLQLLLILCWLRFQKFTLAAT